MTFILNDKIPMIVNDVYFVYCLSVFNGAMSVHHSKHSVRGRLHQASEPVCINAAMTLATHLSLATMESLENAVATHFRVTPLSSMRTVLQASSQR